MPPAANPKRVLVTGVHGLIGSRIYARLAAQPERFAVYGLDRSPLPAPRIAALGASPIAAERLRLADISDLAAVAAAMAGMETVIHLAADPNGRAGWESVLANNIVGTHNLFEAAQQVGVQRVIFASTNQVVFGYRAEAPYQALLDGPVGAVDPAAMPRIGHTWPTRPLNDYACSKIFGEALAHVYANSHGLSCLVVRIGWVTPDDRLPTLDNPCTFLFA